MDTFHAMNVNFIDVNNYLNYLLAEMNQKAVFQLKQKCMIQLKFNFLKPNPTKWSNTFKL